MRGKRGGELSESGQYTLMRLFTRPSSGNTNTLIYPHVQSELFVSLINICSMSPCDVLDDAETPSINLTF